MTSRATKGPGTPLPPGWEIAIDHNTSSPYYWNTSTGETQWERPGAAASVPPPPTMAAAQPTIQLPNNAPNINVYVPMPTMPMYYGQQPPPQQHAPAHADPYAEEDPYSPAPRGRGRGRYRSRGRGRGRGRDRGRGGYDPHYISPNYKGNRPSAAGFTRARGKVVRSRGATGGRGGRGGRSDPFISMLEEDMRNLSASGNLGVGDPILPVTDIREGLRKYQAQSNDDFIAQMEADMRSDAVAAGRAPTDVAPGPPPANDDSDDEWPEGTKAPGEAGTKPMDRMEGTITPEAPPLPQTDEEFAADVAKDLGLRNKPRERSNSDVEMNDIANKIHSEILSGVFQDENKRRGTVEMLRAKVTELSQKYMLLQMNHTDDPRAVTAMALRAYTIVDTLLKMFHSINHNNTREIGIRDLTKDLKRDMGLEEPLAKAISESWPDRNSLVHDAFHNITQEQFQNAMKLANQTGDWAWKLAESASPE